MPYEIFTRKIPRMGTPTLGFSKIGQITFNQSASRILQKEAVEYVLLLWDGAANTIAMKSTSNKKDPRAYRIRYNDKGNGASFSAKTFLDYIGLDLSERRTFPVELNPNNEMFVEAQIPESFFNRKQPQPRIVERSKIG
jgi:hypothetical protein